MFDRHDPRSSSVDDSNGAREGWNVSGSDASSVDGVDPTDDADDGEDGDGDDEVEADEEDEADEAGRGTAQGDHGGDGQNAAPYGRIISGDCRKYD